MYFVFTNFEPHHNTEDNPERIKSITLIFFKKETYHKVIYSISKTFRILLQTYLKNKSLLLLLKENGKFRIQDRKKTSTLQPNVFENT